MALNGFIVASEFAIVKVRTSQLDALVAQGNRRARHARQVTAHLDAYLSATQLGITLAFTSITVLHIVVGELAPKSLAIRKAVPTTLWVCPPPALFYAVFKPAIVLLNGLVNWLLQARFPRGTCGRKRVGSQRGRTTLDFG